MRHRITLPTALGENFALSDAMDAGVGKWRASTRDLARPFHGVRAAAEPITFLQTVSGYLPRMRPHQRFVGRTAMRLWGLPHPVTWRPGTATAKREPLEVAVSRDFTPPRAAGVSGRRLREDRASTWKVHGAHVVDPVAALITCAHELSVGDAVTAIDALITRSANYPGLLPGRPVSSRADIAERVDSWGWFPGRDVVRAGLSLARDGVESPKETETRLLLVRRGLPEPAVQYEVRDEPNLIARVDLAYPELKIAIEYEGDGHRTDKAQWRRDIARQRELEGRGWIVIRLTQDDLGDADALIARIRRAIAARG